MEQCSKLEKRVRESSADAPWPETLGATLLFGRSGVSFSLEASLGCVNQVHVGSVRGTPTSLQSNDWLNVKNVLREFSLVLCVCGVLAVAPSTRLHLGRTGSSCKKTGFCSSNLNRSMENQCGFLNKKNQQPEKQMVFAKKSP